MYCNGCGEALAFTSGHCTKCGALIAGATDEVSPQFTPVGQLQYRQEPCGIGGWLLFFWLGIFILKPVLELRAALNSKTPFGWIISLGIAGLCVVIGQLLFKENPKALSLLRAFFIIELIFAQLFFIHSWTEYHRGKELWYPHSPLIEGTRMTGYVVIWWLYFRFSVRVRNTFGRNI